MALLLLHWLSLWSCCCPLSARCCRCCCRVIRLAALLRLLGRLSFPSFSSSLILSLVAWHMAIVYRTNCCYMREHSGWLVTSTIHCFVLLLFKVFCPANCFAILKKHCFYFSLAIYYSLHILVFNIWLGCLGIVVVCCCLLALSLLLLWLIFRFFPLLLLLVLRFPPSVWFGCCHHCYCLSYCCCHRSILVVILPSYFH